MMGRARISLWRVDLAVARASRWRSRAIVRTPGAGLVWGRIRLPVGRLRRRWSKSGWFGHRLRGKDPSNSARHLQAGLPPPGRSCAVQIAPLALVAVQPAAPASEPAHRSRVRLLDQAIHPLLRAAASVRAWRPGGAAVPQSSGGGPEAVGRHSATGAERCSFSTATSSDDRWRSWVAYPAGGSPPRYRWC
jgi:hypothetical protein